MLINSNPKLFGKRNEKEKEQKFSLMASPFGRWRLR
jgi:hypothetical protein